MWDLRICSSGSTVPVRLVGQWCIFSVQALIHIHKTNYSCTPSDTTIWYFIVILLLATSFGLIFAINLKLPVHILHKHQFYGFYKHSLITNLNGKFLCFYIHMFCIFCIKTCNQNKLWWCFIGGCCYELTVCVLNVTVCARQSCICNKVE
jgi:hypothetical protein